MHLRLEKWTSPLSPLLLVTDDDGVLRVLEFADLESRLSRLLRDHYGTYTIQEGAAPLPLTRALDAYFHGELDALNEIQSATGGTPFQREVWAALRTIPAGTTISYGRLAEKLGRAGSARAVGAANGANPIPIIVPCHRVIGADGTLTGFSSGLPRKRWLLDHESRFASRLFPPNAIAALRANVDSPGDRTVVKAHPSSARRSPIASPAMQTAAASPAGVNPGWR